MLKIPSINQKKNNLTDIEKEISYKEIADTVNQAKIPKYQSDDNLLQELEQFSANAPKEEKQILQRPEKTKLPEEELFEEAPSPQTNVKETYASYPQQQIVQQQNFSMGEEIQEIAESIIEEKWQELTAKLGDFNLWKDRVENELTAIKQEIIRTQANFANLQRAVLGKVSDYNDNISNLGSEMKALEQVFQKIMQPLTSNVKELTKITEKLKDKTKEK